MKMDVLILIFLLGFFEMGFTKVPIPSRANIGLNLAAIYSGLPELQTAVFFNRYVGVAASVGYTNKPRTGLNKINNYDYLTDSKGAYFKLGLEGRYVSKSQRSHIPVPWLKVQYVYSQYDEHGYAGDPYQHTKTYKRFQGSLNAWAITAGADFPIWRSLDINVAYQHGFYHRDQHFNTEANVCQPGLGSSLGSIQMGFTFRIGAVPSREQGKGEIVF